MYGNTKQVYLNVLNMQILLGLSFVSCLLILVPGSEGKSSILARGETPTCPEGSPSYDLDNYAFQKYCIKGSKACNLTPLVFQQTYFYTGVISCSSKNYIIVAFSYKGDPLLRFVLDTLTVDKSVTMRSLNFLVFPVYRDDELGPLIYYKMEDKSCYKVSYKLSYEYKIEINKELDDARASDTCKAVKAGLDTFVQKDTYENWLKPHACCSIDGGPEKVDCAEIGKQLKVITQSKTDD